MLQNLSPKRPSFLSTPARLGIVLLLLVVALILVPAQIARAGGPWYVSPSGDDINNDCLSAATPCQTIAGAIGKVVDAGDTIIIASGTFTENLVITKTLTLQGAGAGSTSVDGNAADIVISVNSGVTVTISDVTITDGLTNTVDVGAGIYNAGTLTVNNCTVINNTHTGGGGSGGGGGITNGGILTVTNSTIADNSNANVLYGSGVDDYRGTVTIINSTISGNSGNGNGAVLTFEGTITLINSTIVSNTSNGLYADAIVAGTGYINVENAIIAGNTGTNCGVGFTGGTITSLGYNIENADDCGLDQTGDITNSLTIVPTLGPLQDNGGGTWTHALLPSSPAVDAGSCSTTSTDQRGYPRPVDIPAIANADDACDVGAYEAQPELTVTKTVDDDTPIPGQTITFTINVDNSGVFSATNGIISDTLPGGLNFVGPVILDPLGAGTTGTPPTLVSGLTITAGERVTVTFPVTANIPLAAGILTNTAAVTSTEVITPVTGAVAVTVENIAPVADDLSGSTDEDTPLDDILIANDDNGDSLTYGIVTDPISGTVIITDTATGSFVYTPTADLHGDDFFTYIVTDTGDLTDTATVTVTIIPVNDAPTLDTIGDRTIDEDAGLQTINLTGIGTGAANETQDLVVTATSTNTALIPHPAVTYTSPDPTGSLSFTPVADQHGTATVVVTVTDGISDTTRSFLVTVNPVNDAPTLDTIGDRTIDEDAGLQTVDLTSIGTGAANETQTLTVTAVSTNTALIPHPAVTYTSPDPTGSLSFTPVADQHGTATVVVTVTDGISDTTRSFLVIVNPVNDAPTLDPIGDRTIDEDAAQTVDLTGIGPGPNESQTLTVTAASTNTALIPHPAVTYTSPDPTGSLSFTPVADQHGTATVVVTVTDGISDTTRSFLVTVNPVNDAPTLDTIGDRTIDEDAGLQTVDLTSIGTGAANETQTLTVTAVSTNTALIPHPAVTYTSPDPTGSLSFTPVADQHGTATVVVTVSDGISDTTRSFLVTVNPVNDAPTLDLIGDRMIDEDAGLQTINLTGIGPGPNETETVTVTAASTNTALIPHPVVTYTSPDPTGSLSFTPVADQPGTATVVVTVSDGISDTTRSFLVTVVEAVPALSVTKSVEWASGVPNPPLGGVVTYTIVLTNSGSDTATGVVMTDTLPDGVSFGGWLEQDLAQRPQPNTIEWGPHDIPDHYGHTIRFTATITTTSGFAGTTITNTARFTSTNAGYGSDDAVFTVGSAVNTSPTISDIPNQSTTVNTPIAIPFTIGDAETALDALNLSAESSDVTLVPIGNILFGGSGANRTVTITPAADLTGTATITITVTDAGDLTDDTPFVLTVEPSRLYLPLVGRNY
ncbi:MAG: tandem-95 repeat protein [Chloroflexota bacterium]|nr:tandem-95 repeat protein [Chloroflexota bacterium]